LLWTVLFYLETAVNVKYLRST